MVISLIGYRATGKSTVGNQLAARLGWSFVDLDREIETRAGRSIADIFATEGERSFRRQESKALLEYLLGDRLVLAPGGGVVLNDLNRLQLAQAGPVVWLRASVESIVDRLQKDASTQSSRPSLTGQSVTAEVADVLALRTPLYEEAATLVVDTDNRSVVAIVDEIVAQLPAELRGGW